MIVKSAYRTAGGLHAHVTRTDTNEFVQVRTDLFRGVAGDLAQALHDMEALARLNPDVTRAFVHIVIAPAHEVTAVELDEALAVIEAEHGIAPQAKRAIVQHGKGSRPTHYHCIYPIIDPRTGRALRSQGNYERDERASRVLEISLGEPITPGPRLRANIAELRARHRHAEADILEVHVPQRHTDPLGRKSRQQATRLGVDAVAWSTGVYAEFEAAQRDLAAFGRRLGAAGLAVARGDRAILIVDAATGHHDALVRLLRREAKASGRPLTLTEVELGRAFPNLPPFVPVRDAGLAAAKAQASAAVDTEWWRALDEARAENDGVALQAFRAKRLTERAAEAAEGRRVFKATLKARRAEIQALYRQRDTIRRLRVDRAFGAARLFASPRLRRVAFALAATGLLLTGASLLAALVGAGVAVGALPHRARARRFATAAQAERLRDRAAQSAELDRAYGDMRRTFARPPMPPRFSFDQVPKADRVLAGVVVEAILSGRRPHDQPAQVALAMQALGPEMVAGLTRMLERGSGLQVRRLLHWHRGVAPERRDQAVAAALSRHAGTTPGTNGPRSPTPPGRRTARRPTGRNRDDGRGR